MLALRRANGWEPLFYREMTLPELELYVWDLREQARLEREREAVERGEAHDGPLTRGELRAAADIPYAGDGPDPLEELFRKPARGEGE